jgi:hypothetical protein
VVPPSLQGTNQAKGSDSIANSEEKDWAERSPLPRWRGDNIDVTDVTPALMDRMAALGCNALRICLSNDKHLDAASLKSGGVLAPFQKNLAQLDANLPLFRKYKMQVILCLAGGFDRKIDVLYQKVDDQGYLAPIVGIWTELAKRYRNEPTIVAYDILNEPTYKPENAEGWWLKTLPNSIAAIRAVDHGVWIVVEPGPWGLPDGFKKMPLIKDSKVVYSFHHYMSHAYTHQGVANLGNPSAPDTKGEFKYPGNAPTFEGDHDVKYWDKNQLETSMQAVIDFQKQNPGVRIYVGEFGVIRWAEGGAQWLADSVDIFEKYGWDWTFHSLGGWNGWDPSYAADAPLNSPKGQGGEETERLKTLREKWSLNRQGENKIVTPSLNPVEK